MGAHGATMGPQRDLEREMGVPGDLLRYTHIGGGA